MQLHGFVWICLSAYCILCTDLASSEGLTLGPCLDECLFDLLGAAASPSFQPMILFLNNATLEQALSLFEGSCRTIATAIDCFTHCPEGEKLELTFQNHPVVQICNNRKEDFERELLSCVVLNRASFINSCGGEETVAQFQSVTSNAIAIARHIISQPNSGSAEEKMNEILDLCSSLSMMINCSSRVIAHHCSMPARLIAADLLANTTGGSRLRDVGPQCGELVFTAEHASLRLRTVDAARKRTKPTTTATPLKIDAPIDLYIWSNWPSGCVSRSPTLVVGVLLYFLL